MRLGLECASALNATASSQGLTRLPGVPARTPGMALSRGKKVGGRADSDAGGRDLPRLACRFCGIEGGPNLRRRLHERALAERNLEGRADSDGVRRRRHSRTARARGGGTGVGRRPAAGAAAPRSVPASIHPSQLGGAHMHIIPSQCTSFRVNVTRMMRMHDSARLRSIHQ